MLSFGDVGVKPDFEKGIGTIVSFDDCPVLSAIRDSLPTFLGDKAKSLQCEGNFYFVVSKCGVAWHGDLERRIVVGLRLGASFPLFYRWFRGSKTISARWSTILNHGDLYVMSDKAVGYDYRGKKNPTLRHAVGSDKFMAALKY